MFWGRYIYRALLEILKVLRLHQPGLVFIRIGKKGENGMFNFVLDLPAPGASDVESRKLQIKIGDGDPQQIMLPGSAVVTETLTGDDNETVIGSLVDIDDADNTSPPRDFSFVLTDTMPPPQPGAIGLRITGEL